MENENTGGVIGLCVSPKDLAVSKLPAGREKDIEFVHAMLQARLVTETAIRSLTPELTLEQAALVDTRLHICLRKS